MVNIKLIANNGTLAKYIHKFQGVLGGNVAVSGKIGSSIFRPNV